MKIIVSLVSHFLYQWSRNFTSSILQTILHTLHDFIFLLERGSQGIVCFVLSQLQSFSASDYSLQRRCAEQPFFQLVDYELFLFECGIYRRR